MNTQSIRLLALALAAGAMMPTYGASAPLSPAAHGNRILVANRGSGNLSVIDPGLDLVIDTIALPSAALPAEPMYATFARAQRRIFVGDRANDRVVAYDAEDFSVAGIVPVGKGVWHMWNDPAGEQLWINGDLDNTATVIDPQSLSVIATVPMPADLVALGGKPHDVVVDPAGEFAFVSIAGLPGSRDAVVMFDTATFREVRRAWVGKDPHLALHRTNPFLYVPTQGSNRLSVLHRSNLQAVTHLAVPGAHGAALPEAGGLFYTTNLPGGGIDGIFTIDVLTNSIVGEAVDTPFAAPHNLALTRDGKKLYVTHSGASADEVSVFDVSPTDGRPSFLAAITVGTNPFGILRVP